MRIDITIFRVYNNLNKSNKAQNKPKQNERRYHNMKTTIYQNKWNKNKYLEIHNDGHYHNSVRQFMKCPNGVKNFTGDRFLHRWRKKDLNELLKDYTLVQAAE